MAKVRYLCDSCGEEIHRCVAIDYRQVERPDLTNPFWSDDGYKGEWRRVPEAKRIDICLRCWEEVDRVLFPANYPPSRIRWTRAHVAFSPEPPVEPG